MYSSGVKPIFSKFSGELSKPMVHWPMGSAATPTVGGPLPELTGTGSPSFAARAGWLTLADTNYFESSDFVNETLQEVFDLQEGVLLVSFQVNIHASATGQDKILSLGQGGGPALWVGVSKATTWRPDVNINFDGETTGTPTLYAGASNEFAAGVDTNICMIIDNRPTAKGLSRFVNGVSVTGSTWAGKGALSYSNLSGRWRFGADAAGVAGSNFYGAFRRVTAVNFGTELPSNINGIVQSLHQSNSRPTRELLLAVQ